MIPTFLLLAAVTNPARVRRIDVKHVAIDLRFDWAKKVTRGTTTITLAPMDATPTVRLDAGMLAVRSVALGNGAPLPFSYDGKDADDGLVITLDRTRPAGEDVTLSIVYETRWINDADPNNLGGSDGKGIRYFGPTTTEPLKRRQVWSGGVPQSNRYWFPCYDGPDDLFTTELSATVPTPLTAVSNGTLVNTTTNPDGTRTFHWRTTTPHANQATTFVVGEYTDVTRDVNGVAVHGFGYPDEVEAMKATVVRLPEMMGYFAELTGAAYPYPSYSQAFVQDHPWGFSGAGMSTLTENMVDDYPTHADYFYLWDGLEAEALAQQWFGGHLAARDWSDAWLNKGFSHYFDQLWTEHKNGRDEFLLWNHLGDLSVNMGDWNGGNRHPIVPRAGDDALALSSDNYPYIRGALVLHMLRKQLGEEVWRKALRRYVQANAGRSVTTEDFRRAVEEASGEPLGWFFDQWLYSAGHPVFTVTKQYDDQKKQLTLTVTQTQTRDSAATYPQVQYFAGKVDVTIDDRVEQVWLAPRAENVLVLPAATAPRLVGFDRGATWIKEVTFIKPLDELLYQVGHDSDVTGLRWAMSQLAAIARKDSTPASDKAKIHAGFRTLIESNAFWRVRYAGLVQLQGMLVPAGTEAGLALDDTTRAMLLRVIRRDSAWTRSQAVLFLGVTRDPRYADLYTGLLRDKSHVVSYAAATALGQSRSPKAYHALVALMSVPSWKGENRLSGLNGLTELKDPRGVASGLEALADQSATRWYLSVSRWDYRMAGADLLAALGKGEAGHAVLTRRFERSVAEDDVNDMFSNVLLMVKLGHPGSAAALTTLREKFKDDANALAAVAAYEAQLAESKKG